MVVEPDHFYGSYELLADCAAASGLPAVAKDFVVSDVQLEWARDAGASAVLLIAALYDAAELRRLAALARGLGLVPLIETHDDEDFEKLRSNGGEGDGGGDPEWQLVGINNRDLRTFEVDLERSADRVGRLPASALKVAESGIHTGADVAKLRRAGFDAFLIGERLVLSGDPAAASRGTAGRAGNIGSDPMKVKICGATTPADARLAVDLGADFVGLNFYRPSPRWIDVERGRAHSPRRRGPGASRRHLRQPHPRAGRGDRPARSAWTTFSSAATRARNSSPRFSDRAIRVRRVGGAAAAPGRDSRGGLLGGPDRPRPRSALRRFRRELGLRGGGRSRPGAGRRQGAARVFIAGGIGPGNIAEVAAAVPGAYAVDTCSGVESSPGHKDRAKLEQLFANLAEGASR